MNPRLTPAARRLRTEIICRPGALFTHARPCRAPLVLDPRGDAAHMVQGVRDEAPADVDAALDRVVASLPGHVLDDMGVTARALTEALITSRPYEPVCA